MEWCNAIQKRSAKVILFPENKSMRFVIFEKDGPARSITGNKERFDDGRRRILASGGHLQRLKFF